MLTDEGCLEEVRPPEHLVHGADGAELEPPVLDLEDAGDAGHEDDGERARQRLDRGRALARLHLVHAAHRKLPQRPDLHHEEQRHRALREQHEEQQLNHTDRPPPPSLPQSATILRPDLAPVLSSSAPRLRMEWRHGTGAEVCGGSKKTKKKTEVK
jgi:hypothetical protein